MAAPPLLLHAFPSFAVGGVQARFATIVNHWGRRWRHAIVAMDGDLSCRERLDPRLDLLFPRLEIDKRDALGTINRLRAFLRELRPAKLVTSNWGTIDWALANRTGLVPQVHVEDGFGPEERARQLPRRVWTRRLVLAGRTVVVPSRTLERIALHTWRLSARRVRYVPNGIDLARFGSGPAERVAAEPVIGTVAALRAEKNVGRMLRAFAGAVSDGTPGRLLVVGDGPEREALHALAGTLGLENRVHWAGHRADPAPLLRGLDAFALSSDTEQMPMSLLEAMAARLPVASTDVGDVSAMLPPPSRALVVPVADEAGLAAAFRRLLTEPGLRAALGDANRRHAEAEFDGGRMLERWAELFS